MTVSPITQVAAKWLMGGWVLCTIWSFWPREWVTYQAGYSRMARAFITQLRMAAVPSLWIVYFWNSSSHVFADHSGQWGTETTESKAMDDGRQLCVSTFRTRRFWATINVGLAGLKRERGKIAREQIMRDHVGVWTWAWGHLIMLVCAHWGGKLQVCLLEKWFWAIVCRVDYRGVLQEDHLKGVSAYHGKHMKHLLGFYWRKANEGLFTQPRKDGAAPGDWHWWEPLLHQTRKLKGRELESEEEGPSNRSWDCRRMQPMPWGKQRGDPSPTSSVHDSRQPNQKTDVRKTSEMWPVEASLLEHREGCGGASEEKLAHEALVVIPAFWWPGLGAWPRRQRHVVMWKRFNRSTCVVDLWSVEEWA